MKAFYDEVNAKIEQAKKVEPVLGYIRNIIFNAKINKPFIKDNRRYGETSISSIDFMWKWDDMPIVISCFDASIEWVVDHILYPLRWHYGCFYTMNTWNDLQKVVFNTKIKGIKVVIQLMSAKECVWEEVETKSYKFNCEKAA